jgi:2-dehydro-3-deoxyphosphogluconate aldolase/(4S)-4-hydroxy-2-oxoglutarate aldolase
MSNKLEIISAIKKYKICAIIRGAEAEKTAKIAQSLFDGGIRLIEVTFNTDKAIEMIEAIKRTMGDKMYVGAGTVLDQETAKLAINAGAEFILSPSISEGMIKICNRYGKVAIPGIMTPSEAVRAMELGADILKLFPAGELGPGYLKSIRSPLNHVEFIAVGGINSENAKSFMKSGAIGLGIGSSLVDNSLVINSKFTELEKRAEKFVKLLAH